MDKQIFPLNNHGIYNKLVKWLSLAIPFLALAIYLFPEAFSWTLKKIDSSIWGIFTVAIVVSYIAMIDVEKQRDRKKGIEQPLKFWSLKRVISTLIFVILLFFFGYILGGYMLMSH